MTQRHARIAVSGAADLARTRDRVLALIVDWGVTLEAEQHGAIKLVTSELVTNAVTHAAGPVTVALSLDDRLLLAVYDGSQVLPARLEADYAAESGRGLLLVEAFASRSGWDRVPEGKKVWAEWDVVLPTEAVSVRTRAATRPCRRLHVLPKGVALAGAVQ
ncbi:ATP-binding protein [Streptomyces sp. YS-3]|uniref:ATP-binding protein n=1 Tax=Streptomyces sp. YS-3 TaxID=3381352 RepID=UPI0038621FBD